MKTRIFAWLAALAWFSTFVALWLPVAGNHSPDLPGTFAFSLIAAIALTVLACAVRNGKGGGAR